MNIKKTSIVKPQTTDDIIIETNPCYIIDETPFTIRHEETVKYTPILDKFECTNKNVKDINDINFDLPKLETRKISLWRKIKNFFKK